MELEHIKIRTSCKIVELGRDCVDKGVVLIIISKLC